MLGMQEKCLGCRENITLQDHDTIVSNISPRRSGNRKVWHFQCTDLNNNQIDDHYRSKFNSWFVQKLLKENIDLKHKTETMKEEIVRLMQKAKDQPQNIEDFLEGFTFYSS